MSAEGVPVVRVVCDLCDGTGTITIVEDYDFEGKSIYAPDECPECEGRLYVERTLYVDAAHPAAASAEREAQIRAEVIEEAARYAAAYVVSRTVVFPQSGAIVAEAVRLTALHFSARATKEL